MIGFQLQWSFVVSSFQLWYKEKYYNSRGQYISLPITPQLMHCYHVNDITSEVGYQSHTNVGLFSEMKFR